MLQFTFKREVLMKHFVQSTTISLRKYDKMPNMAILTNMAVLFFTFGEFFSHLNYETKIRLIEFVIQLEMGFARNIKPNDQKSC